MNREERLQALNEIEGQLSQYLAADKKNWIHTYLLMSEVQDKELYGIISESACSTGACLYFGMAVIKLLSLTSSPYYQILKNSEKLKHFEIPSKDTLKIIR